MEYATKRQAGTRKVAHFVIFHRYTADLFGLEYKVIGNIGDKVQENVTDIKCIP